MKNIALIVLAALLPAAAFLVVDSQQRYESLNDEYWLAKTDQYILAAGWLQQITDDQNQDLSASIRRNIEQERKLIELCIIEECVSQQALRLINSMLDEDAS